MGFWCFMLAMDLLIPLVMMVLGCYFYHHPPKQMNMVFGYRTTMSMKNQDTWQFAHRYCGKLWGRWGIAVLLLTLLVMLGVMGESTDTVGIVGGIVCLLQLIPMLVSISCTERALKRTFTSEGQLR